MKESPIDPEKLINSISEKVTANILKAVKQTQQDQTEQFLTIKEAAEFLNLSVSTLYSKCSRGELPFMKRSKRLYFSSVELMEYLKAGRKNTNAELEAEAEAYLANKKKGLKKKGLNNGK
ncbi:MAG TPA: helix-turn-helix domain-containing protein [Candidatus Paceibacterota bacterium]|nr:helix-turn-helix domain-containing protein [Candidatus Paceibacterota bacterium]